MIFGKKAFENSSKGSEEVLKLLMRDSWKKNEIEKFIEFWSSRLWLTIDGMDKRIEIVYKSVLKEDSIPSTKTISDCLKIKSSRWKTDEVKKIAPIIKKFLLRNKFSNSNIVEHHTKFQNKLGKKGPVYSIWCHYLVNPRLFPPIDKFNHASYKFITSSIIPSQVPNNFSYIPIECDYTNYQEFRKWFLKILKTWKENNYKIKDVVKLDKSLMSFGAFIIKNDDRDKK